MRLLCLIEFIQCLRRINRLRTLRNSRLGIRDSGPGRTVTSIGEGGDQFDDAVATRLEGLGIGIENRELQALHQPLRYHAPVERARILLLEEEGYDIRQLAVAVQEELGEPLRLEAGYDFMEFSLDGAIFANRADDILVRLHGRLGESLRREEVFYGASVQVAGLDVAGVDEFLDDRIDKAHREAGAARELALRDGLRRALEGLEHR